MPTPKNPSSGDQYELPLFAEHPGEESGDPPGEPLPLPSGADPEISRVFSDWNRPMLEAVSGHLLASIEGERVFDLSNRLIVVPTRHAGRRLRERLALEAARRKAAVFPPLVVTGDYFSAPERIPEGDPVATHEQTRLIWAALLLEIELTQYRHLFPADPIERDLTWAMKTADELLEVRNLLTESGLNFATASDPLRDRDMEPLRWKDLSRFEATAIRRTQELGLRDETLSRLDAARSGALPSEVTHLLIAGTPDLVPLTVLALERIGKRIPVTVMILAPESESHRFDSWGRPVPEHWLEAEIPIPEPEETIHAAAFPTDQAELACERVLDHLGEKPEPAAVAAIGVPDPEVIAPLEQSATRRNWSTYDPAGQPVSHHGIYYLLDQTAAVLATRSFESVTRLLRCPDFTRALVKQLPTPENSPPCSATSFLALVDDLREHCLPDLLEDALSGAKRNFSRNPHLEEGLRWIADWMQRFRKGPFATVLIEYLSGIFSGRSFTPRETAHGAFSEVATAILEAETAFEAARKAFGRKLRASERFQLLLELIRQRRLYEEREPENIDLEGWLELLWEDAPHLVVTGMNDHVVPETIMGHAFLPDSARRALKIPDNDDRFARDAYLLTSLIQTRRGNGGRLDLIFGRQSESGDPLRPSRLLFQCSDGELPGRTLQFFGGEAPATPPLPWSLPWKLTPETLPDDEKIFSRLSVTQFGNYLTCPFRFYLQHGLRMEEIDPEKSEMDARDFGNLVHGALEQFAGDPEASSSKDPKEIRISLENEIDAILNRRFGTRLSTPVLIQREAARRRLGWWSEIEAEERRAGWRILEPETRISTGDHPFELAGHPIVGRIDRIEEHEDGRLRVFDFKTHSIYDSATRRNRTVSQYHIAPIKRTEDADRFPEWAKVEPWEGKPSRWVDLQIPLYLLALARRFPGRDIEAGHIVLGPTRAEVLIDPWTTLDQALLESAQVCAEGVIEAIRSRIFWPPAERLAWSDPFEELLFGEPEESVDASGLGSQS